MPATEFFKLASKCGNPKTELVKILIPITSTPCKVCEILVTVIAALSVLGDQTSNVKNRVGR